MPTNATIDHHNVTSDGNRAPPPGPTARTPCARAGPLLKSTDHDIVYLIDVEGADRRATRELCEQIGYNVETFSDVPTFLTGHRAGERQCLLIEMALLGIEGFEFIQRLKDDDDSLPCIVMSADPSCPMVVQAMRAGACDFIEKPISRELFAASLERALNQGDRLLKTSTLRRTAAARIATLSQRQHQIMDLVIAGNPSKNIAADLGISQRTVENHRASIGRKTGSKSLSALIQIAIYASSGTSLSGVGSHFVAA